MPSRLSAQQSTQVYRTHYAALVKQGRTAWHDTAGVRISGATLVGKFGSKQMVHKSGATLVAASGVD